MEVCKTDAKNIIQFLEESAALVEEEVVRRNALGIGTLRLQNRARLMRLMSRKLTKKLNKTSIQNNNGKEESSHQREGKDAEG